ncbi:MAG: hypothetical protein WBG82_12960 [Parvibaculum sp.]|uniref:hypothetical protein n=1 Tax=Parvibaculum sp. TaxID=2024848 RepID=UPI003C773B9B
MAGQINEMMQMLWMRTGLLVATLLVGAVIAASPANSATPVRKFESWSVQCLDKNVCIAYLEGSGVQILVGRTAAGQPIRLGLRILPKAKTGQPASLRLESGWQAGLKIGKCSDKFCEVPVGESSTNLALEQFLKTREGVIAYQVGEKILIAPFSLAGFKAALKEVRG